MVTSSPFALVEALPSEALFANAPEEEGTGDSSGRSSPPVSHSAYALYQERSQMTFAQGGEAKHRWALISTVIVILCEIPILRLIATNGSAQPLGSRTAGLLDQLYSTATFQYPLSKRAYRATPLVRF